MEFLRSFLGRHLAGKPVVASPNVGCFLRLKIFILHRFPLYARSLGTRLQSVQYMSPYINYVPKRLGGTPLNRGSLQAQKRTALKADAKF